MYRFDNMAFTKRSDECDLSEHIYVSTEINILVNILRSTKIFTKIPLSLQPTKQNNNISWQRNSCGLLGSSYMIFHKPYNSCGALYAVSASLNNSLVIYKNVNGADWKLVINYDQTGQKIKGNISKAIISKDGRIYLATVDNLYGENEKTYLYSSEDPEFYPWKLETGSCQYENYDRNKNPRGGITAMVEFNNKIYVGTSTPYGAQIWRTNKDKPCVNDWTLVGCSGFGDEANRHVTSMGVFNNSLYVGLSKPIPLACIFPMGCDIAKIDKSDTWEIVIGSNPIKSTFRRNKNNFQQFDSGFNNPFNIYACQIKELAGILYITTFNNVVNLQSTLELILANIDNVKEILSASLTEEIINIYKNIIYYIESMKYQFGFDLYTSYNGYNYKLISRCSDYNICMEEKVYEIYDYLYELLKEPTDYLRCHWDEIINNMNKFIIK